MDSRFFFSKTMREWNGLAFAEAPSLAVFRSNFIIKIALLTLCCLAASSSQPGHHGVSAISNNLHDPGCY